MALAEMPTMTPAGWLAFLEPMLDAQAEAVKTPDDYFNGNQRLAFATAKFREAFSRYFPPLANNWMKIIVEAPVSRIQIQGFRFDVDPAANTWELDADADAWNIWQTNKMDSGSRMVHTEAIKLGVSYVLVRPPNPLDPFNKWPVLTPEHASQCVVYSNPENRNGWWAGFKRWVDPVDSLAHWHRLSAQPAVHVRVRGHNRQRRRDHRTSDPVGARHAQSGWSEPDRGGAADPDRERSGHAVRRPVGS